MIVNIVSSFCEVIMNSTSYSYSRKGELLGGESSKRSCYKDGSIIFMIVKGINLVCGNSVKQVISPKVHGFTSLTQVHVSK